MVPAFDIFLARYSADGQLKWSTNLYQKGDSAHVPDQKGVDLHYDPVSGDLCVLAKQHGSNVYRFLGDLVGDTGNLMISWVGKVDPEDGRLKSGWYFQNRRPGSSPKWPKLAGNSLKRIRTDAQGRVYLTGSGGAAVQTSAGAFQEWPADQTGGFHGTLIVLSPDLSKVEYATLIRPEAQEANFAPFGMVLTDAGVILGGKANGPLTRGPQPSWASPQINSHADATLVRIAFE